MENWGWHHGFTGGGMIMGLVWVVVLILAALLVFGLLRDRNERRNLPRSTPKQILQERYARGEIGREEFLEKLQDLDQ